MNKVRNAVVNDTALHYINAPDHAAALIRTLHGNVTELAGLTEEDPLLYAHHVSDRLPKIAGLIIAIQKWSTAVMESTPDQIQDKGAQLCL